MLKMTHGKISVHQTADPARPTMRPQVPKVNLLVSGLLGKKWTEAAAMVPVEQLSPAKWEQYQQYAVRVEKERSLDPLRVRLVISSAGIAACSSDYNRQVKHKSKGDAICDLEVANT